LLKRVSERLHKSVASQGEDLEDWLGVVVLARCGPDGFFAYQDTNSRACIGESQLFPGRYITPNDHKILEGFWAAKVEEGAEKGVREGPCSISGEGHRAISTYCKAWPWALRTWTCPVPHAGNEGLLVEGIALSEASYRALTLGANLFHGLTRTLHHVVLPELFAPVENRDRQNAARNRRLTDLPAIWGSAFLLPVRDAALADPLDRDDFARQILAMLATPDPKGPLADRYLTAVTGFDVMLPEELNCDDFRLTLVYFSGDVSRGDVHLRAYIQDVLPSTAGQLKKLVRPCREEMDELLRALSPNASEKQRAYLGTCYQSVPYFLARGYGGSHLWTVLEQCLHRRALDARPLVAHAAARIASVVPRWPDSRFEVIDEVIFLLVCRGLIHRYNREVAHPPKEDAMPMRPWRELLEMIEKRPPGELRFETVAELGFSCGALVRRFAVWYWKATKVGDKGKDYLKQRVLTFGADLSPEVVWRVALGKLCDVAARYETDKRPLGRMFRERLGVLLTELERRGGELRSGRDEFMTAFWAGYCLHGYDRPHKPKATAGQTKGGAQ
jgi:hypothetical protein